MKSKIKNPLLHCIVVVPIFCLCPLRMAGQSLQILPEKIAVIARPSTDSITLRWAPLNRRVWHLGNTLGYRVERYTLARNGSLLPQPEKKILVTSFKHLPEDAWETLVRRDKYAAIAAQALFGERFEVNLKETDIFAIVSKVRENEQRFLFSLFGADMSPQVARACGLMITDKQLEKGEKYLYRVVIHSIDSLRGSMFVGPDEPYSLPRPQNLKGDFKDQQVFLRWDQNKNRHYTAYIVERSEDGKQFESISDSPVVTVSPTEGEDTRYEYAVDTLSDRPIIYHYRVKGLTPFGEVGPPSAVITGKVLPSVNQVPYISNAENQENASILIRWEFPEKDNHSIEGFAVERSPQPDGTFKPLHEKLLPSQTRIFEDRSPQQSNYYRITAHGLDDALYHSHIYFAQLVDSIPPSVPLGLEGKVYDDGLIKLSWKPNADADIYGYRIYKAYHQSEELAQITEAPITQTFFTDQVDLNTLNETVYYSVMALDINQNHSRLSSSLKVALPDRIRPQPPVFLPPSGSARGVSLRWVPGGSADIVQYNLYRMSPGTKKWEQIQTTDALSDTVYSFLDENARPGQVNHYTIVAIDDAGLESIPAHPVTGSYIDPGLRPAVSWMRPRINRELSQITLQWNYDLSHVQSFKIFQTVDDRPPVLFQTIDGEQKQFTHTMIPGRHYRYRIMACFMDGKKSFLSDEIEFRY
jgi:uncharacterized protein